MKLGNASTGLPGDINNNETLGEARRILEELRQRNFTLVNEDAVREKTASLNATVIAATLKEQANAIKDKASQFNNTFVDLLAAFKHVRNESGLAKDKSANASSLVNMAKNIDWKVRNPTILF